MKIALIQMDIVWGNSQQNIRKAAELLGREKADLYVLPEMWATGYSSHPEEVAEEEGSSEALAWMKAVVQKIHCAICGSLAICDSESHYRNRLYFVTPDAVTFYDKHHLFTYAHEDRHYLRGDKAVTVCYQGVRFLLQVCYDLRFPVWSRWGRAGEYDAIIYVANWPAERQDAWNVLLRARAIENQCFVLATNRIGTEHQIAYQGQSALISPQGRVNLQCGCEEQVGVASLDVSVVSELRSEFPVLADRD